MMAEIPLFPLNTVLFPGTDLHLHIFEERYKVMISSCLEDKVPFGVVLIKRGFEAFDKDVEPFRIGCTAAIHRIEKLDNGNFNIVVRGLERFRLLSILKINQPYSVGKIKMFPFNGTRRSGWETSFDQLSSLVKRYLNKLSKERKIVVEISRIPDTPFDLATFSANILLISTLKKQYLLSLESVDDLLDELVSIYKREITILDVLLMERKTVSPGAFSIN